MSGIALQGRSFEDAFHDLWGRLIGEIGWTMLQNRIQPPGAQFGKDIQTRFRTADGREFTWHIECKSHRPGSSLRKEELLPKLFDLWRSPHAVDVWCLALAHVEIGNPMNEMIAALKRDLNLPFEIVTLSSEENDIRGLFALEPDLAAAVYRDAETLLADGELRQQRLKAFRQFLLDASLVDRQPRDTAWQLVAPHRLPLIEDSPEFARAYLRGFEEGGWESVVYEWAVRRNETTGELVTRFEEAPLGVSNVWLVGSAGEGKSTLLRQAALEVSERHPDALVLWAAAVLEPVRLPQSWLEGLRTGTRAFLCVDGTRSLRGAGSVRSAGPRLAAQEKWVVVAYAERGIHMARSVPRKELARWSKPTDTIKVQPLTANEAAAVIAALESRDLLAPAIKPEDAAKRLLEASRIQRERETSWLLPTMMMLTDREGRNFEQILESVLVELKADGEYAAAALLLAASLAQAADVALPDGVAELLMSARGGYGLAAALEALRTELGEQRLSGRRWESASTTSSSLTIA